jgi:hypothetical protein
VRRPRSFKDCRATEKKTPLGVVIKLQVTTVIGSLPVAALWRKREEKFLLVREILPVHVFVNSFVEARGNELQHDGINFKRKSMITHRRSQIQNQATEV